MWPNHPLPTTPIEAWYFFAVQQRPCAAMSLEERRTVRNGIKLVHIYAIPMTCEALDVNVRGSHSPKMDHSPLYAH